MCGCGEVCVWLTVGGGVETGRARTHESRAAAAACRCAEVQGYAVFELIKETSLRVAPPHTRLPPHPAHTHRNTTHCSLRCSVFSLVSPAPDTSRKCAEHSLPVSTPPPALLSRRYPTLKSSTHTHTTTPHTRTHNTHTFVRRPHRLIMVRTRTWWYSLATLSRLQLSFAPPFKHVNGIQRGREVKSCTSVSRRSAGLGPH